MADNVVKTLLTAKDASGPAYKSATTNMERLKATSAGLATMLGPLIAVAAAGAVLHIGKQALDSADRISKLSDSIGISTEALSQYNHVAQLSGTSFETVATSLKKMQKNISDAADGLSTAKRAFRDVNLEVEVLQAMKPEDAFELIGDELNKITDRARRSQVAMNIFGRAGGDLIPIFKNGSAGIREMREEADRLGLTLSGEMAQDAADAKDAMQRLDTVFDGISRTLAIELAPAVTELGNSLAGAMSKVSEFLAHTKELNNAEGGYANWVKEQDASKLLDDLGLATAATLGFKDALHGIKDVGDVFQFGEEKGPSGPGVFDSSFLKDLSVPSGLEHESMMQASADVEELINWWASLVPALDGVDAAALNVRLSLDEVTRTSDEMGLMIGEAGEYGAGRMADALADAVAQGKLELLDLGMVARSVFGEIFSGFLQLGVKGLFAAATGGIGAPMIGALPIPGLSGFVNPIAGTSGASGGIVIHGGLNVEIPQSVDFSDPISRRQVAQDLYNDLQIVASHHGPED